MKFGRRTLVAIALAIAAMVHWAPTSFAVTLMTIQGNVQDKAGQPIVGALVTDGGQIVTTDATGHYSIAEEQLNTYVVRAYGSGLVQSSRNVGPVEAATPVNFVLDYTAGVTISPAAFKSLAAQTITASVKSRAPASSCATWVDGAGVSHALTYASTDGSGFSTWTGSAVVAAGTAQGTYNTSGSVSKCAGPQLSTVGTGQYKVDNTAPVITDLLPALYMNVANATQPLSARVTDPLSGVGVSSVSFTLRDLTTSTTTTHAAVATSSGYFKTAALSLTPGRVYTMSVTATDAAGNSSTLDQGTDAAAAWLAITATASSANFSVVEKTGSVDVAHPNTDGTFTATFENVEIATTATSATFSGAKYKGHGALSYSANPLEFAKVCTVVTGGIESCSDVKPGTDPGWGPKAVTQAYSVPSGGGTVAVPSKTTNIGTLTARVQSPTATLKTVTAKTILGSLGICKSPIDTGGTPTCTPDPLRITAKAQAVDLSGGTLLGTAPVTYQVVRDGHTGTMVIEETGTDEITSTLTLELPDSSTIEITSVAVKNAVDTITVTTTNSVNSDVTVTTEQPGTYSVDSSSSDPCWPCAGAAAAAAGAGAAACFFGGPVGCILGAAAAAGAAAAYCSTNPCEPDAPSCNLTANLYDNRDGRFTSGNTYWNVYSNNYVQCGNEIMEYLEVRTVLYTGNEVIFDNGWDLCTDDHSCWQSYLYHLNGARCYKVYAEFEGQWRNPATNEVKFYAGEKWSNQICI